MHAVPALPAWPSRSLPAWAWISVGGSLLALADLAFAAMYWSVRSGTAPIRIPQSIAAWVLGSEAAHAGGAATALAGLALYACVVCAMVAGYAWLVRRVAVLRAAGLAGGVLYGWAMYALLFLVLLPSLSASPAPSTLPWSWIAACLLAYAGIGVGCAGIARCIENRHGD